MLNRKQFGAIYIDSASLIDKGLSPAPTPSGNAGGHPGV